MLKIKMNILKEAREKKKIMYREINIRITDVSKNCAS